MKTYIIHVSNAKEREIFIKEQTANKHLDITFVNDGDKKDLTQEILSTYFSDSMKDVSSATSCAYKHLLAYQLFLKENTDYALIFEDDIYLYKNFNENLQIILNEIKKNNLHNFIVSVEDTNLQYIKNSEKIKNKHIYLKDHGRMAGAYIIDRECANNILNKVKENRCNLPIDWFHNYCSQNNIITIYWSNPVLGIQGSLTGKMPSLIDDKKVGALRIVFFGIQKTYKKILYKFL